jgi:hypothetical protein
MLPHIMPRFSAIPRGGWHHDGSGRLVKRDRGGPTFQGSAAVTFLPSRTESIDG